MQNNTVTSLIMLSSKSSSSRKWSAEIAWESETTCSDKLPRKVPRISTSSKIIDSNSVCLAKLHSSWSARRINIRQMRSKIASWMTKRWFKTITGEPDKLRTSNHRYASDSARSCATRTCNWWPRSEIKRISCEARSSPRLVPRPWRLERAIRCSCSTCRRRRE